MIILNSYKCDDNIKFIF